MVPVFKTLTLTCVFAIVLAAPVLAEGFQRIDDERKFTDLMKQYDLKRFGIRLKIGDNGQITGRAFGQRVSGAWDWENGFFCRDLYWGGKELDADNCQLVEIRGNTVRFTSNKGNGDHADLRLE